MDPSVIRLDVGSSAILVLDRPVLTTVGDELISYLNLVLDPEGKTDAACDFDDPWDQVWVDAVARVESLWSHRRPGLCLLTGEGAFFTAWRSATAEEQERILQTIRVPIEVTQGEITVVDAMTLFDGGLTPANPVPVNNGTYSLAVHHLAPHLGIDPSVVTFGTSEWPALVFDLGVADHKIPETTIHVLELATQRRDLEQGHITYGRVKRLEGGIATLELLVGPSTFGGFGKLSLSPEIEAGVGDLICVKLLEYHKGRWQLEWAEHPPM